MGRFVMLLSILHFFTGLKAEEYLFIDPAQKDTLVLSSLSRYERLRLDALNPTMDVGYSYFTFQDTVLEELSRVKLDPYFKSLPQRGSFRLALNAWALEQHNLYALALQHQDYEPSEFQGYTVSNLDFRPLGYLNRWLHLSVAVQIQLNASEQSYTYQEVLYLNLESFDVLRAADFMRDIPFEVLRQSLKAHWKEKIKDLPDLKWGPHFYRPNADEQTYQSFDEEEESSEKVLKTYSPKLVEGILAKASLEKGHYFFNGSGLLVALSHRPGFFDGHETTYLQFLVSAQEGEALWKVEPFAGLALLNPKPFPLPVDPFDFDPPAFYTHLNELYFKFLQLEDTSVQELNLYQLQNHSERLFLKTIKYRNGKAVEVNRQNALYQKGVDHFYWRNNRVYLMAETKPAHQGDFELSDEQDFLRYQWHARTPYGNTRAFWDFNSQVFTTQYSYWPYGLARSSFAAFSLEPWSLSESAATYIRVSDKGLHFNPGEQVLVNDTSHLALVLGDQLNYKQGRLVQRVKERGQYDLYFYDEAGRLKELQQKAGRYPKVKIVYPKRAQLPSRIDFYTIEGKLQRSLILEWK